MAQFLKDCSSSKDAEMKTYGLIFLMALILGCTNNPDISSGSRQVNAVDGNAVAASIQLAYQDTRHDCGNASKPAFLCAGVLFRGTSTSGAHHAWNPAPGKTGVSFSYVRKDANFDHLAVGTDNGFIFYPILSAPSGKDHMYVLCSFPIDGYTWIRAQPGCGESSRYPGVSGRCQSQGISTADQWKAHFDKGPSGADRELIYGYVCAFDVSTEMNALGAESFYQSLRAMHLLPAELKHRYNELIVQAWAQDIPAKLPIQAFFYTSVSGLVSAKHNQWDFFNNTGGIFVPIIHMTLPAVVTGDATFTYNPADQYCQPDATSCL
ncbi:halovibrin HvnA [Pseudomonas sp. W2-17]|uniref:halovibrin HvnA n=1 Tax=Pseudomonas sp. W2-17 TaxID=3058039 RepID=UPI0034E0B708